MTNEVWSSVGEGGKKKKTPPKSDQKGGKKGKDGGENDHDNKKSTRVLGTNSVRSTRLANDFGNLPRGWKVHWSEKSVKGGRKE